ncbi:hypothetical protein HK104_006454 [Borealophlyctis nickersoniae]|nr:hypothetical protein HK104_006454 [Borealophlyctis nickersoniae]
MGHNHTTQQDHFQEPEVWEKRTVAHAPSNAARKLLFPLKTGDAYPSSTYETTMHSFFGPREGLCFEGGKKTGPESRVNKGMGGSSIVFGDPKVGFYGDAVPPPSVVSVAPLVA